MDFLQRLRFDRSWNLERQQLKDDDVKRIAEELKRNAHCEVLNLNSNKLSDRSTLYLSEMLKVNKSLKELYLSENEITDNGLAVICEALTCGEDGRYNNTLQMLDISCNLIGNDSYETIVEVWKNNNTLKRWSTSGNPASEHGNQWLMHAAEEYHMEQY